MSGPGHNSAAYGESLCEDAADDKKLFHYVQWHLADYIAGTQGMSPEQEGIYVRFLMRLYNHGKPLRDDDGFMASLMILDVRRWRRVKSELIAFGKIVLRAGSLTNSRFEKERLKRAAELKKQADATSKYWQNKRVKKAAPDGLRGEVGAKSDGSPNEVQATFYKKTNEINDEHEHPNLQTRDESLEKKERKKENNQPPPVHGAVVVGEVDGLNGATSLIIGKLAGWINPMMPDKRTARVSIENFVSLYSGPIVRDAFAELEAKMLHGDVIARPIPYLASACQRRAQKRDAEKIEQKPDGMPQKVWNKIQSDIAAKRAQC